MISAAARSWLLAFRPKTLSAAVAPVVSATALAYATHGRFDAVVLVCALACTLFIQVGTNLVNDALDFKKGADTHERLGPIRATQAGLLTSKQVMAGGLGCFAIAAVLGIPLVIKGGIVILGIGLVSLACGYAYTGGPAPLAYVGLGDLFVMVFFGLVAVGGTYYLHTGTYGAEAFWLGLQMGALATMLIAINNLRDARGDAKVGKRTLAVRLGPKLARVEIAAVSMIPFAVGVFWLFKSYRFAAIAPLVVLPLALSVVVGVYRHEPGPVFNTFLARAGATQILFGILVAVGLVLS